MTRRCDAFELLQRVGRRPIAKQHGEVLEETPHGDDAVAEPRDRRFGIVLVGGEHAARVAAVTPREFVELGPGAARACHRDEDLIALDAGLVLEELAQRVLERGGLERIGLRCHVRPAQVVDHAYQSSWRDHWWQRMHWVSRHTASHAGHMPRVSNVFH